MRSTNGNMLAVSNALKTVMAVKPDMSLFEILDELNVNIANNTPALLPVEEFNALKKSVDQVLLGKIAVARMVSLMADRNLDFAQALAEVSNAKSRFYVAGLKDNIDELLTPEIVFKLKVDAATKSLDYAVNSEDTVDGKTLRELAEIQVNKNDFTPNADPRLPMLFAKAEQVARAQDIASIVPPENKLVLKTEHTFSTANRFLTLGSSEVAVLAVFLIVSATVIGCTYYASASLLKNTAGRLLGFLTPNRRDGEGYKELAIVDEGDENVDDEEAVKSYSFICCGHSRKRG
jgi:hypothetical protein